MGGQLGQVRVGALVALAPGPIAVRPGLVDALTGAGFDVAPLERVAHTPDLVGGGEVFVVVVDDVQPHWMREINDLVRQRPEAKVLALVDLESAEEFLAALTAGVAGFVSPTAADDAIVRSVSSLLRSGVAIPRAMVPALVDVVRHGRGRSLQTAAGRVDVTDREWAILELLIQGRTTREMAERMFISVGTVRSHVSALLKKLGAVDREDAIRLIEHRSH